MLEASCEGAEVPRLAGVELVGRYDSPGANETYLIRRADGRMVEVSPLLYAVATHIDGVRDVAAVASETTRHLGRRISAQSVAYVVEHKLRPLGVVSGGAEDERTPSARPVLTLGLRRTLLGKTAVGAIARTLRPLFCPQVVVSVLAALVVVDAWLLVTTDVVTAVESVIYRPEMLLVVWGLTILAAIFHELGHATATRYGGATPGPIGVGIYLVWPAFYNDLADVYRLSRGDRLRADLGGVYFNAVFVLAVAVLYRFVGFGPLFVVVALQHVVVAQQFLPFVRLDGYYILSDAIGVPDLFAHMKPILVSLIPGRAPDPSVASLKRSTRVAVAAWALSTVTVLAASLVVLAVRLPHFIYAARHSIAMHADQFGAAAGAGHIGPAVLEGLQLTVLAVPFVGASLLLTRLLRATLHSAMRRRAPIHPPPTRPQRAAAVLRASTGTSVGTFLWDVPFPDHHAPNA